ncbi:MAG: uroporphyrinogen-III synthase, partial [Planctomycetota bacterium]
MRLVGKVILNTRPRDPFAGTDKLSNLLQSEGAKIVASPAIELRSTQIDADSLEKIRNLDKKGWLVFVSQSGVQFFQMILAEQSISLEQLEVKMAAIGPATKGALEKIGCKVDLVPEQFNSRDLANRLVEIAEGDLFLIRASRGNRELVEILNANGKDCVEFVAY